MSVMGYECSSSAARTICEFVCTPRRGCLAGGSVEPVNRGPRRETVPGGPAAGVDRSARDTWCVSSGIETATPLSGLEVLERRAAEARAALDELLDQSSVYHHDVNQGDTGMVFLGWNKWHWTALPDVAQPAIGRAREATERLREFARAAVRVAAPDRADQLDDTEKLVANVIEQPNGSLPKGAPASSIDAIRQQVAGSFDGYLRVLRSLPSAQGEGESLLVADTSALLDQPNLQQWQRDSERSTIVALPQVLSELDERKRDPRTRDAALKVSRQIEDLDRRGDTFVGVPLAGKLRYRDVAVTADMTATLPWLRADVPDDIIVAGALELTWQDLTARVAMVASDRNVRLKARRAGLSTLRPEEV